MLKTFESPFGLFYLHVIDGAIVQASFDDFLAHRHVDPRRMQRHLWIMFLLIVPCSPFARTEPFFRKKLGIALLRSSQVILGVTWK